MGHKRFVIIKVTLIAGAAAILIIGIRVANHWINAQVSTTPGLVKYPVFLRGNTPSDRRLSLSKKEKSDRHEYRADELVKHVTVVRGANFLEYAFKAGDKTVAWQKVTPEGVIESEGYIPGGEIRFIDHYNHEEGVENWLNGRRHGSAVAYYPNGKVRWEKEYDYGRIVSSKRYYKSGVIRFESDMRDALEIEGNETGIGRLYYPDGVLKFEWNLTNTLRGGYKRSYNRDGTLRHEARFDQNGREITNGR